MLNSDHQVIEKKAQACPPAVRTIPETQIRVGWGGTPKTALPSRSDEREQLVNGCLSGPITEVSLPEAAITSLRGILLDFDPERLHPTLAPHDVFTTPTKLWSVVVKPWLDRHPVFAKAEVRSSGRGLHVIVRLSPPVVFETEVDHQKWSATVKIIQKLLPTDPDCPGITAMTRPVGSMNSKNGVKVSLLQKGQPVPPDSVMSLATQAVRRPFGTVAELLYPTNRISPCPVCGIEGTRLDVLDHVGMCYGKCGKVRVGQLFDRFLAPRPVKKGGA